MSKTPVVATVTHRFAASADAVYDAWLSSANIRKWFAPGMGEMTRIAVNARVGGTFLFAQRRGIDEVEHVGTYLELHRPQRIAFTWQVKGTGDESRVHIDIVPSVDGSTLTLRHELDPRWESYREKMAASWTRMLEAMERSLTE
jgi:uncharacterized protein YndB with AHSA1/START domain